MAKTVMIVPDSQVQRVVNKPGDLNPATLTLHQQNWVFAQQFKAAAPGDRDLVTVPVNGSLSGDFIPAVRKAASQAGNGGMVILFTGHGCREACEGGRCRFAASPDKFGFETVPETSNPKTKKITGDVFKFLEVAQRSGEGWAPRSVRKPGDVAATTLNQANIDALTPKWEALDAMRTAFTTNKIDRLILLTCNVGTFPDQCQTLANILATTVVAYTAKIATNTFEPPIGDGPGRFIRPVRCWATAPPHSESAPRADHLTTMMLQKDKTAANVAWLQTNWKRHPYFAMIPPGPGVECKPNGQPNIFG